MLGEEERPGKATVIVQLPLLSSQQRLLVNAVGRRPVIVPSDPYSPR